MKCNQCQYILETPSKKLAFRSTCPQCGRYLHSCTNCRYFTEGAYNSCSITGVEKVSDKDAMNFCEEFAFAEKKSKTQSCDAKEKFNKLFRENG